MRILFRSCLLLLPSKVVYFSSFRVQANKFIPQRINIQAPHKNDSTRTDGLYAEQLRSTGRWTSARSVDAGDESHCVATHEKHRPFDNTPTPSTAWNPYECVDRWAVTLTQRTQHATRRPYLYCSVLSRLSPLGCSSTASTVVLSPN